MVFSLFNNAFKNIVIIILACVGVGFLIYIYAAATLEETVAESLIELAEKGARIVESDIDKRFSILETIAALPYVKETTVSLEEKARYINELFGERDFSRLTIIDRDGVSYTTDGQALYMGDREHFRWALAGERVVSEPIVNRLDHSNIIVFAVPIRDGDGNVGVLHTIYDGEALSRITDLIHVGEIGNSFIVNARGEFIAHDDRNLVYQKFNPLTAWETDGTLKDLARLERQMLERKTGAGSYQYQGVKKYMGYAPIGGTSWALAVTSPYTNVFQGVNGLLGFLAGTLLIIFSVLVGLNLYMTGLRKKLDLERAVSSNAIEISSMVIIEYDDTGKILDFNRFAALKTGYAREEVIGKKNIQAVFVKEDHEKVNGFCNYLRPEECPRNIELEARNKTGEQLFFMVNFSISKLPVSNRRRYVLMGIDITERVVAERQLRESHEQLVALNEEVVASEEELRTSFDELLSNQRRLHASEERYELVVDTAGIGIWDWEVVEGKWFYSREWFKIFRLDPETEQGKNSLWEKRIHPEDLEYVQDSLGEYFSRKSGLYECEYRILLPGEEVRWVHVLARGVWDWDGKLIRMAGSHMDITQIKLYQKQLEFLAYHDPLTNLPNRRMLQEFWQTVNDYQSGKSALLFIDTDNFKLINDTLGHTFGDQVIVAIGSRLKRTVADRYKVFRISGDEFIVLIEGYEVVDQVKTIAGHILESFAESLDIQQNRIHISVSMGISIYPDHGAEIVDLLKKADIALYQAKSSGKNKYIFYDQRMQISVNERMLLEKHLRNALSNQEFFLCYQPQICLKTEEITGFEALLRWIHPEIGIVSPLKFVKVAEESGLINAVGEWALRKACGFIKQLMAQLDRKLTISVNISILQLMQEDCVDKILRVLEDYQLAPDCLELEITESMLIESFDVIYSKLEQLRSFDISIALDDFGTGYSSLNYLRQLPISTLKIDKSFVDSINYNSGKNQILTGNIVAIGHKMGLQVIAEGVETRKQLDYLIRHQCDKIQGYIFSKPLPEREVLPYLKKYFFESLGFVGLMENR